MDKKISQLQEVLASDGTTYLTVVQGAPLLNAIIKPDKLIDSAGGMLTKDYVGDEATKSVHNSDELGNILAEEYVTYVNNYKNVDLSNNTLLTKGLKLNTSSPYVVQNPGEIGWNASEGTVDLRLFNNTTLQVGQEIYFYGKAIETIANGNPVMIAGVQGNHLTFKNAVFSELSVYPQKFLGVATQNIAKNDFGYVTWFGKVNDVYTTGWAEADNLYISPTNSLLTNVQPQAPNLIIRVGSVIKLSTGSAENGIIGVRPTFGIRMQDLNDVNGTPLTTTGQIPVWDNARKVHDFTKNINDYQRTEQKNIANGYAGLDANKKLSTEFETDPIFVTSPAHTITDNNITNWNNKENTANKQNSLATDGTGTKFPTVDAVNAGLALKHSKLPYATYTHSANKEIYITAIDYDTNTFTSVLHGLINGSNVYPVFQNNLSNVIAGSVLPGGMTSVKTYPGYYIVNKTNDTFQLSLTDGGTAIDLTINASADLAKWHFEDGAGGEDYVFSNLPAGTRRIRLTLYGRLKRPNSSLSPLINSMATDDKWLIGNTFNWQTTSNVYGNIYHYIDIEIDSNSLLKETAKGVRFNQSTSDANTGEIVNQACIYTQTAYASVDITSITFKNGGLANGAKIELYIL